MSRSPQVSPRPDAVSQAAVGSRPQPSQLRVEYLLSHGRGRSPAPQLGPELLRRMVPDLLQREIYVCGPPGMRTTVRESLHRLGAREEQIHAEVFRLAP